MFSSDMNLWELFLCCLGVSGASAYLLVAWFETPTLMPMAFRLLWKLDPWRYEREYRGEYFWPDAIGNPHEWDSQQATSFCIFTLGTLGKLLTCPVCLCLHVCFWFSVAAYALLPFELGPWYMPVLMAFASSFPALAGYRWFTKEQESPYVQDQHHADDTEEV